MAFDRSAGRQYHRDNAFGEGHADPKEKELSLLLETWRDWLHGPDGVDGYPEQAVGFDPATSTDFEEMGAALDLTIARAVDAAVGDLPHNERIVVLIVWGASEARVWRFREPHEVLYQRARATLMSVLQQRGLLHA